MNNNRYIARLKREFDQNPVAVIGVCAAAIMATSKLVDSLAGVQSKRAYAQRMSR